MSIRARPALPTTAPLVVGTGPQHMSGAQTSCEMHSYLEGSVLYMQTPGHHHGHFCLYYNKTLGSHTCLPLALRLNELVAA